MSAAAGPGRVTLLTDFGTRDGFAGAVKGVLAAALPGVPIDDVAHDVPRGDTRAAARAVARYWRRYPEGTVHLVVIDPGVGTARRALACSASGRFLVGPDNGVLSPALSSAEGARCVSVDERVVGRGGPPSATFHARDLFAPAAATLAAGRGLDSLGTPVDDPVLLAEAVASRTGRAAEGQVIGRDRFGNLTTNLPGGWAESGGVVEVAGRRLELVRAYGDVAPGAVLALVDSEDRIEIAVRDGSAARALGIERGEPVRLLRR